MITVDKTQESISLAIGMTQEEFDTFGDKITKLCTEYADIILSGKGATITRLDFLETLTSQLNEKELLLLALTTFEGTIQQTITFVETEKPGSTNAITVDDLIEDPVIADKDELTTETIVAEVIAPDSTTES